MYPANAIGVLNNSDINIAEVTDTLSLVPGAIVAPNIESTAITYTGP
jgi:hypothetical protein